MFIIRCSSFIIRCFSLGPICLWFFSFFNIFTDFSFVSSVLFFSFFSRFLFTFCSVSLSFVTVVVPLLSLPFVSSFRFFAGFSNCFFFQVVSSIYSLSDFPRYPHYFSLPSCNLLLQVFLCNFPRFFLIFLHSSVFDWNNVVFFLQTWFFFVTYAHVITALCRRWKIIMSITHVENNNQARYEAIRRVCLWRVQMRVIVHCATFSHNISN